MRHWFGRRAGLLSVLVVLATPSRAAEPVPLPSLTLADMRTERPHPGVGAPRPETVRALRALRDATGSDDPDLPEILCRLRLAEATQAWAELHFGRMALEAPECRDAPGRSARCAAGRNRIHKARLLLLRSHELLARDRATSIAARIVGTRRLESMRAEALWKTAAGLEHLGEDDKAAVADEELRGHYAHTRWGSEAWLARAERRFELDDMTRALEAYDRALEGATPEDAAFVAYRRAWTIYRLSRYEAASNAFADLVAGMEAGTLYRHRHVVFALRHDLEVLGPILSEAAPKAARRLRKLMKEHSGP